MEEIKELNCCITDTDYTEGLTEIINNLKTIQIDTRAMNDFTHCRYYGQKEMLEAIIKYLEKCL